MSYQQVIDNYYLGWRTECAVNCMQRFMPERKKRLSLNWQDNNAMHAKPDLRVVLEWKIAGSGSVIADVIMPLQRSVIEMAKGIIESITVRSCSWITFT